MGKRLFTDEELREMSTEWPTLALEALDAGDIEKARYCIEMADKTKATIHDGETELCADLMSAIYRRHGIDEFVSIMEECQYPHMKAYYDSIVEAYENNTPEDAFKQWVTIWADWTWKQHCGNFWLEETDESVIFHLDPCGSGGKLLNKGYYDGENPRMARVKEAGYWSFGVEDTPIYCCHDGICDKILCDLADGEWMLYANNMERPYPMKCGDECQLILYKDPKNYPKEVRERLQDTR